MAQMSSMGPVERKPLAHWKASPKPLFTLLGGSPPKIFFVVRIKEFAYYKFFLIICQGNFTETGFYLYM